MRISYDGLASIASIIGIAPAPYIDMSGAWASGVQHSRGLGDPDPRKLKRGMPADLDTAIREAIVVLIRDCGVIGAELDASLARPIAQHQYDALVAYRLRSGSPDSGLIARVNAGDHARVSGQMQRRGYATIQSLYWSAKYPGADIWVWSVSGSGARATLPARTLTRMEFLSMLPPRRGRPPKAKP